MKLTRAFIPFALRERNGIKPSPLKISQQMLRRKIRVLLNSHIKWLKYETLKIAAMRPVFQTTPPRNYVVIRPPQSAALFLLSVPPKSLIIYDDKRRNVETHSEAYNEGTDVVFVCEASGGE